MRNLSSFLLVLAVLVGPLAPAALAAPTPKVNIAPATVSEGDTGLVGLLFPVTLSRATTDRVTVDFATSDGSAFGAPPFPEASDYVPVSGTVTFEPGDTLALARVDVRGDLFHESNETVVVTLSNALNASIDTGQAEGQIVNDDPLPEVSISNATTFEGGRARFTVTLSRPSLNTVSVTIATADGTASAGTDYEAIPPRQIAFLLRHTSGSFDVQTNADSTNESIESFTVTLSSPNGATIADGEGLGLIVDRFLPVGL